MHLWLVAVAASAVTATHPGVLVPTPILTDNVTFSLDRSRHSLRYVTHVKRKDFVGRPAHGASPATS